MTFSAAQVPSFYEEGNHTRLCLDPRYQRFPAPLNGDGARAMPFWSLRSRAERVVESVPAYAGFEIVSSCQSTSLWHGGFLGSPEMGFGWGSTGRALEQPDTTSPRPMSHVDCGASHGDRRAGRLDAVQAARRL